MISIRSSSPSIRGVLRVLIISTVLFSNGSISTDARQVYETSLQECKDTVAPKVEYALIEAAEGALDINVRCVLVDVPLKGKQS